MGYISCRLDYDDLEFWKKKYDELIKFYKLAIIAYEDQSKQLNNIISKATGAAMRATGIDVYEIDGEKNRLINGVRIFDVKMELVLECLYTCVNNNLCV